MLFPRSRLDLNKKTGVYLSNPSLLNLNVVPHPHSRLPSYELDTRI